MSKLSSLTKNSVNRGTAVKKRRPGPATGAERKPNGKRAERLLKESELKYRSLFEQTLEAVMITDLETGIILEVNDACAAMFGYPREKLTGMHHQGLLPQDKSNGYKERFKEQLENEPTFSVNLAYLCASGKTIQVNVSTTQINVNGKRVIQNIFRGVAEGNSLLENMTESEEKFSRAFHGSPDAMSISDLTDGRFIEVNESFMRITGYTREELINRSAGNFSMWATPEDRQKMLEPIQRREKLHNVEVDLRLKNGSINTVLVSTEFVQISGRPCLLVVSTNISEYKRTKKALDESEEQLTRIFRLSPQQIIISRVQDGKILDINEQFARITGFTREETIGRTSIEVNLWHKPEDRQRMLRMLKENGHVYNEIFEFRIKSGAILTTLYSAEPIEINGESCLIAILTDITERKRLEQAQKESEEKFSKAFHALPERIIITRISDGMILDINDSFLRDTGHAREDTVGHTVQELKLWADPGTRDNIIREIQKDGHIVNREITYLNGKGEPVTTLYSADIITIGGEPCMISITTNITERKRMEQALKESEEKFSKAFYSSPAAMCIFTAEDYKFTEVNDSFTAFTGYSREEAIGRTGVELNLFINQEEKSGLPKSPEKKGTMVNRELRSRMKSGEIRTGLFSTQVFDIDNKKHLILTINDITEQAKAQEAIANEAILRRVLIHDSSDGIVILDSNGKVFEANKHFTEMLGYTAEEMAGLYVWDWEYTATRERLLEMITTINEAGDHFETQHRRKDGTLYDVDISTNGAIIAGQKLIFCVCRDITQRKQMENALKASEEKLSKAFRAIPESITISRVRDGVFVEANDNFCRITGRTRDEVIGHTNTEIGVLAKPGQRAEIIKTIQTEGSITNNEISTDVGGGEIRTTLFSADIIDIGGEPCIISISTDITERKRMEEALRTSEEKFTKAFRSIPQSIAISRISDGVIVDANDNFCRSVGHSYEEIIGHTDSEINLTQFPGNQDEDVKTIRERGSITNREIIFNAHTEKMRALLFSADIIDFGGEPCVISISTDITEHRRMEQTLADDAVRRRLLIDQSRDGIVIIDHTGAVYEANRRFAEMHGYAPEEALKLHIWDWEKSLPREQLLKNIQIRDEKGTNFEAKHLRKDGSVIDVEVSSNGTEYAGQKLVFSVIRDISERKRMEQALRESEEKFSKAFHAIPESVSISRLGDGTFIDVNESFCRLNNLSREEIIGLKARELGLWEMSSGQGQVREALGKQPHFANVEYDFKHKNGEVHTVLVSADVFSIHGEPHVLIIGNDITDRKRMERALRESEEKFSKAFQAIPETVSISRISDGIFVDINKSFLRSNQLTHEQVIGHTAVELKLWNNPEEYEEMVRSVKERGSIENDERQLVLESGDTMTLLYSASTTLIAGEPCIIAITNNITVRKQMEEQLKKALADLQVSNARLKATNKELESFSYSVSHDLRSPLRSIDGFSQALLEDYAPKLDETARDYLNRMRSASQKMGELIDGLLKLSRLTRNEMHYEAVDLSALVQDIGARLHDTDPKRKAEFIITPGLKAAGDAQMLRVMMENLVGNAWKFTKKVPQARIEFGSSVSGGEETFFIKDNGAGFDMAYRDKLFSAFQRLHDTADFPGTGIGLATVQRIINRHGGTIRAEGAVGRGAAFYFTL